MIWMEILQKVNGTNNISNIYKEVCDITWKTTRDNLRKMEKTGLVVYNIGKRRTKVYSLTEEGVSVLKAMNNIKWKGL